MADIKVCLSKKGIDSTCSNQPIICKYGEEMSFVPILQIDETDEALTGELQDDCLKAFTNEKLFTNKGKNNFKLTLNFNPNQCGKMLTFTPAFHIDPQLKNYFGTKNEDFIATFGPNLGKANMLGVHRGDIFLFFGWYKVDKKNSDKEKEKNSKDKHIIWGYMQVGDVIELSTNENQKIITINNHKEDNATQESLLKEYPSLKFQPHWKRFWENKSNNETIYVARYVRNGNNKDKICDFYDDDGKQIQSFGIFNFNKELILTDTSSDENQKITKGKWKVDDLKNVNITNYTNANFNEDGETDIASRGYCQEVILDNSATKWAKDLIKKFGIKIKN